MQSCAAMLEANSQHQTPPAGSVCVCVCVCVRACLCTLFSLVQLCALSTRLSVCIVYVVSIHPGSLFVLACICQCVWTVQPAQPYTTVQYNTVEYSVLSLAQTYHCGLKSISMLFINSGQANPQESMGRGEYCNRSKTPVSDLVKD
jgi:hypothetical protein